MSATAVLTHWAAFLAGFLLAAVLAAAGRSGITEDDLRDLRRRWIEVGRREARRERRQR